MLTQTGAAQQGEMALALLPWELDIERHLLRHDELEVRLEPKVMQTLLALTEEPGQPCSRDQLIAAVWGHQHVTDDALNRCISALRQALRQMPGGPDIETLPKFGYVLNPASGPAHESRNWAPWWIAAAIVLLVAAAGWRASTQSGAAQSYWVTPLTHQAGLEVGADFSPDSAQVAYAHRSGDEPWRIWLKTLGAGAARQLSTGPGQQVAPAWSPDGRQIAFLNFAGEGCELQVQSPSGGAARSLGVCHPRSDHGIAWSGDSRRLVFNPPGPGPRRLAWLDLETLVVTPITQPQADDLADSSPSLSPDGRLLAFVRWHDYGVGDVYVLNMVDQQLTRVTHDAVKVHGLDWADQQTLVLGSNRGGPFALWRLRLPDQELTRLPLSGVELDSPAVAQDGRLLVFEDWRSQTDLLLIQPAHQRSESLAPSTRWEWSAQRSPDQTRLAWISDRSGSPQLWVGGADGSEPLQLTRFNDAYVNDLSWSVDGQSIYFAAPVQGQFEIFRIAAGGGAPEQLSDGPGSKRYPHEGGNGMLYWGTRDQQGWQVRARSHNNGGETGTVAEGSVAQLSENLSTLVIGDCIGGGLKVLSLATGTSRPLLPEMKPIDCATWDIDGSWVTAVLRDPDAEPRLVRASLTSGAIEDLRVVPSLRHGAGLDTTPQGVIVTVVVEQAVDLMLAEQR